MPFTHNFGLTDLVQRPTSGEANLTLREKLESVQALLERKLHYPIVHTPLFIDQFFNRVARHRPRILALVSFGIWDCVLRRLDDTMDGRRMALRGVHLLPAPTDWTKEVPIKGKKSARRGQGFARWKIVYPGSSDAHYRGIR